jgi:hypothetical protein
MPRRHMGGVRGPIGSRPEEAVVVLGVDVVSLHHPLKMPVRWRISGWAGSTS